MKKNSQQSQKSKHHILITLFAISLLIAYQARNFTNKTSVDWRRFWKASTIEIKSKKKTFTQFAVPGEKPQEHSSFLLDDASRSVAELGHLIKFKLGITRDWLIASSSSLSSSPSSSGPIQYVLRSEIPFQYSAYAAQVGDQYKTRIDAFRKQVEGAGAQLVIVPVPTKLSIHREYAPTNLPRYELWKPERLSIDDRKQPENPEIVYRTVIQGNEDIAIDLFNLYKNYRKTHQSILYGPTESHWTSLAIALASQEVVRHLMTKRYPLDARPFEQVGARDISNDADLVKAFQLPTWFSKTYKQFQWSEPLYNWAIAAGKMSKQRLLVLGSSYSRQLSDTPHSFPQMLHTAIGRELLDESFTGAGFTGGIHRLHEKAFQFQKGDLVIWEFPIRFFPNESDKIPEFSNPNKSSRI